MRRSRPSEMYQHQKHKLAIQRKERMDYLIAIRGGKCSVCGYDKCKAALDFHHIDPKEKDFNLSQSLTNSLDRLEAEAMKCILLCANCHRELHTAQAEPIRGAKSRTKNNVGPQLDMGL